MKWLTFRIQREPGFRFNLADLILLLFLGAASAAWYAVFPARHLYLLPLYVGGSFFLFCNVFRIGNRLEAPWYLLFLAICVYGIPQERFPWSVLLVSCEALKWLLIATRIRRGPYRGLFHRHLGRLGSRPASPTD